MADVCFSCVRGQNFEEPITLDGTGSIASQSFAFFLYIDRVFDPLLTRTTAPGGGLEITNPATREVTVTLDSDTTKSSTLPAGDYRWEVFRTDGGFEDRLAVGWLSLVDSGFAQVDGPPLPTPGQPPLGVTLGGTGRDSFGTGTLVGGNGTAALVDVTVGSGLTLLAGVLTADVQSVTPETIPVGVFVASQVFTSPLIVRQPGGVVGVNQVERSHTGSQAVDRNRDTGGFAWVGSSGLGLMTLSDAGLLTPISIAGSAAALTNLNASALASGTVPDARLAANVARTDVSKVWTALQTFSSNIASPITGFNNTERFGAGAAPNLSTGQNGLFIGPNAGLNTTQAENTVIGVGADVAAGAGNFGNVVCGRNTTVTSGPFGTAVGDGASTSGSGTSIGAQAVSDTRGFALGYQASATGGGIALGYGVVGKGAGTVTTMPNRFDEIQNNDHYYDAIIAGALKRSIARVLHGWVVASPVDGSQLGFAQQEVYNGATPQTVWRAEANASGARLGFFGVTAAARPVLNYSRSGDGETVAVAQIRTALAALGLADDQTTA